MSTSCAEAVGRGLALRKTGDLSVLCEHLQAWLRNWCELTVQVQGLGCGFWHPCSFPAPPSGQLLEQSQNPGTFSQAVHATLGL